MDKYIGRLLDNRYEILEVIGTGGMAVVYKARCHRLNRLVAIKILKDDFLEDEEFRRRFHSESQAVAMLSHPNIISVYDVSTSITADYIVMELIDGITLKQYMEKKGVLNWKETLHFAIQIAKALEHAHSRGIVHRDIKPHNVMVLKNGSVKVTDFGIARMMSKGNTLTKEALGSVHYISPEQAKGGRVDNRSDIYSLGVVMYEMMSGRPPYDGEAPVSVAIQHINGGAAMPSTLNPNIPGGLEQIIMRAMAHEPDNRYATAVQMLADLDDFRKDPSILFDYNTPPTDAVTSIPRPQPVTDMPPMIPLTVEKDPKPELAEILEPIPEKSAPQTIAEGKETKTTAEDKPAAPPPKRPERRTPPAQPRKSKREAEIEARQNKITTIAIICCAVVMVFAIVVFLFVLMDNDNKTEAVVPNIVGRDYAMLELEDFKIKKENEVYSEIYPAGQIISQSPEANTTAKKGNTIYVTVSLGPMQEPVLMPALQGKERIPALEELEKLNKDNKLGLKYLDLIVEETSETVPKGVIISTDPEAGTELTPGQEIKIVVSLGQEVKTSTMPQLEGEKFEQAEKMLNDQGLNLNIVPVYVTSDTYDVGYVVSTEPAFKETISTGQTVTVNISSGREIRKDAMPNLVGMTKQEAEDRLKAKKEILVALDIKYVPEANETVPMDSVIRTEPAMDAEIKTGDTIVVYVSSGPKTFEMPDLSGMSYPNALAYLKLFGYDISKATKEYIDSSMTKDAVVKQSVPIGDLVAVNAPILLTLSNGTPEATEPTPPPPPEPVTKQVTVTFEEGKKPTVSCSVRIFLIGENGEEQIKTVAVPKDAPSFMLSVTGIGVQQYRYEFYVSGGGATELPEGGTFEVNFDE